MPCPECKGELIVVRCPCTDELQYVCKECGHTIPLEQPDVYTLRKEAETKRLHMPGWY